MEVLHSASFMPNIDQLTGRLNRIADDSVKRNMCHDVGLGEIRRRRDLQAADLMLRRKLRLLPVVDGDVRLVGAIVRRVDLFKHVL